MINTFISAIIALFFIGNTSKEEREKTRRASLFRTFVYFCLTIIVGIIFYKSYQVSNIINVIDLKAFRCIEDSLHQPKDIAYSVSIYNKFHSLGSYNNDWLYLANQYRKDSLFTKNGGVLVKMSAVNSPIDSFRIRYNYDNYLNETLQYLKRDISEVGQYYGLAFISTNIPCFIPFYPKVNIEEKPEHKNGITHWWEIKNARNNDSITYSAPQDNRNVKLSELSIGKRLLYNGVCMQKDVILDRDNKKDSIGFNIGCYNKFANTIGILTASDISQFTYSFSISSDIEIKKLVVEYNLPIEIAHNIEGISVGSKGFSISENALKKYKHDSIMLHIKLPTMANLQLIRSLILTALLTTLFSLFCRNCYYLFRKRAVEYHKAHKLSYSQLRRISRRRLKIFKVCNYVIAYIFIILLFYMTYIVATDRTLLISFDYLTLKIFTWITAIVIGLSVCLLLLYKYSITPIVKYRGTKKIKEREKQNKK